MKYVFILIFSFLLIDLLAQSDFKFTHISTANGLSQSTVQRVFKDSRGFMWFGTRDGLNKYDGNSFVIYKYDPEKKGSISNNYINDIFEDKQGNLWIATSGGLNKFDRKKNTFVLFDLGTDSGVFVSDIFQDRKGNVWLTTKSGLFLVDLLTGSYKVYRHNKDDNKSISDNEVTRIAEDSDRNLWVGTGDGLNKLNPARNTFIRYQNNPSDSTSLINNYISTLYIDSKNNVLIGTEGGGIAAYDKKNDSFINWNLSGVCGSSSNNLVLCINEGFDNNLWIGKENEGLYIYNYNDKSFKCFKNDPLNSTSIASNSIRYIYKDNTGNMWLGTYSSGVEMLPKVKEKFAHYKNQSGQDNGLNNNTIKAILEDTYGDLWFATDGGGINFFDRKNKKFHYLTNNVDDINTVTNNTSHCILELNKDTLVFGYHRGGFDFYNKRTGKFTHFYPDPQNPNSISDLTVSSLHKDKAGNLWLGTWKGGLDYFNIKTKQFKHYINNPQDKNSLNSNLVYSIKADKKGNLWLATNKGVDFMDKKSEKFTHYLCDPTLQGKLTNNTVYCIHIDQKENVWAGTLGGGLNLLDKKTGKFTTFREKDGLPNNVIEGILEDAHGNLWISTNNGISKFNPKEKSFRNFGVEDGVQGNEFKRNSYFKNKKGEMFFGGINGFNIFHPDSIKHNPIIPNIVFTGFQIFNKPVEVGDKDSPLKEDISEVKEITLDYNHSVFTFKFAALNYIHPEKNQYAYKLDGFDKNWNYVGTERKATYTNLDPGKYVFRVKACNNDGIWNEEGAYVNLIITPPFWKTLWFRMLIIGIIMGSAFAWYQARMNIVKRQKEKLEQQVKERTEELQAANVELISQKEELQTSTENLISQSKILQDANEEIQILYSEIQILYSEIKDSIRAAEALQKSILPSQNFIKQHLQEMFILYKPKDVVSGDFYWFDVLDNQIIIAAVDCTGHGVSGAFMSINGHHLLNQFIYPYKNLVAAQILDRLNDGVIKGLHAQGENQEIQDGMDIGLCILDKENMKLQYSGANNPLYILRGKEIIQVKANKFAIGLTMLSNERFNKFSNNEIDLQRGDIIYLFSDGYADQLGGPENEKFMYPRFRSLLMSISDRPMEEQLEALEKGFHEWKGREEQIDDILVIGFKIPV